MVFVHDSRLNGVNEPFYYTLLPVMVLLVYLHMDDCTCLVILVIRVAHLNAAYSCRHEISHQSIGQPIDVSRRHGTIQIAFVLVTEYIDALLVKLVIEVTIHRVCIGRLYKVLLTTYIIFMGGYQTRKAWLEGFYYIAVQVQFALWL